MKFRKSPSENDVLLETVIHNVLADLDVRDEDSDKYPLIVDQLTKLHAIRNTPDRVSKDALIGAAATLLSVIAIVGHERIAVVTSKAMTLIPKPR